MIVDARPDTTVFRATRRSRQVVLFLTVPLVVPCLVPVAISLIIPAVWPIALVMLTGLGVSLAYGISFWLRSRVEFGGGRYRQAFALATHDFVVADIAKIIAVDAFDYGMQVSAHLFVVGTDNRRLARLNDLLYERTELEQLVADLRDRGVPMEQIHDRITMRQFDRLHPGVLNPWESHRVAFTLLTAVATLAILAAAALFMLLLLGVFA
jgi:hypothetical protein